MHLILWTTLFLFGPGVPADDGPRPTSPRLGRLLADIDRGTEAAVEAFWEEVLERGAPLVEARTDASDRRWLTFLYRGDEQTSSVFVLGGVFGVEDVQKNRMQQLGASDVWFLTLDVRSDLRGSYGFAVNDTALEKATQPLQGMPSLRRDVLNPARWNSTSSLLELPDAVPQPWWREDPGVEPGFVEYEESFRSEILGNERRIGVYLPPGYVDDEEDPYPMLLCFDLGAYTSLVPTPTILDNLIDAGKIPPMVAVLVGNANRSAELPCNPSFAEFLATELIPWVREEYTVSEDPSVNVVAGSSYGGLASSWFGFQHPEIVGNVLSQSGSYWWGPDISFADVDPDPAVEGEWLTRQFACTPRKDLRFFMDVGLKEGGNPSMVVVNRHLRDVLQARGYEIVDYVELNSGHEYLVWRGTLADGLIALVGDL